MGFVTVEIPFTQRAKKVSELSLQEADQVGQKIISIPILLLVLIRIANGVSTQVLDNLGIDIENLNDEYNSKTTAVSTLKQLESKKLIKSNKKKFSW